MDFQWSTAQREYRLEVRDTIQTLLPADWHQISCVGVGSTAQLEFSRQFCSGLSERGLLVPHWPEEYGGGAMGPWEQLILAEELCAVGEPRGLQYMNVNYIGPAFWVMARPSSAPSTWTISVAVEPCGARAARSPMPDPTWPRCAPRPPAPTAAM